MNVRSWRREVQGIVHRERVAFQTGETGVDHLDGRLRIFEGDAFP